MADGTVRLWALLTPVLAAGGPVNSVTFAPGGTTLAVGGPGLELRDPGSATMTAAAPVGGTLVNTVAFRPCGASAGGTMLARAGVRLWDTSPAAAACAVCAIAARPLSRVGWARYLPGRRIDPPCPRR